MLEDTPPLLPTVPYPNIASALAETKFFSRRGVTLEKLLPIAERLAMSAEVGARATARLLDGYPQLQAVGRLLILQVAANLFIKSELAHESPDPELVLGLTKVLTVGDVPVRNRALKILLALGEGAAPAQDAALGCLRNANAEVRLGGAQLLRSIGAACSRSFVRPIRQALEKYPKDEEFCRALGECLEILSAPPPGTAPAVT